MAAKVCKVCLVEKDITAFGTSVDKNGRWIRHTCKECSRLKNNEYSRLRNLKDKEKVRVRNKAWAGANREHDLARKRTYNGEHKEQALAWHRNRRATNLDFRLRGVLRCRLRMALNGLTKSAKTMDMLGCSTEELRKHLESKWSVGMMWENYGGKHGWQIDHILPCASFDLSKPEDQRKCFHFTNLQPMWAVDNRAKGTKIAA